MLRIITFCLALILAVPIAHADAAKDCDQSDDLDQRIRDCSEIINGGIKGNVAVTSLRRHSRLRAPFR